jgi:predicted ATP-dependent serine protease
MLDKGIPSLFFSYEVIINNVYKTFLKMGVDETPAIYTPKKNVTGDINWVKEKIKESDESGFSTKIIVIDHLDFLTAKGIKTSDVRRNEITNIITELKNFAIENEKIIILLAHVVKKREGELSNEDIADSRSIANLADIIMFVSRKIADDGSYDGNMGRVRLTKNRITGKHVFYPFFVDESCLIKKDYENL